MTTLLIISSSLYSRRGVTFRRVLAEAKQDITSLEKSWNEGKRDAIAEIVKKLDELKEKDEDQEELIEILDSHFDPEKKPKKPEDLRRDSTSGNIRNSGRNQRRRRNSNPRGRSLNKENQGQRSNSSRKRSGDKRVNNNNNNNNVMDPKSGAIRKEQPQHVDSNQNAVLVAAQ